MAEASGITPQVVSIGFSGQMHGVVVADRNGEPQRPAVLWSDQRSQPDLDRLRAALDTVGETDGRTTLAALANPVVAGMAGPSVAALRRDEPDVLRRAAAVMQPKDWARWQLTGELATDPSDASATLLWHASEDRWSSEAAEVFGVDPAWLPPVLPSATPAGLLRDDMAAKLLLPAGIPVAVGAADTAAALLGAGLVPGETQVSTGTGGQIAQLTEEFRIDETGRTHLFRAAALDPDAAPRWYAMAAMQNVGIAIEWARSILNVERDEIDSIMAEPSTDDADDHSRRDLQDVVRFQPYLTGERTPHLDATLTGGFTGLRPSTTRAELLRAVFQGVADAMGDGRRALLAAGYKLDEGLLAGGGSLAPWWRQMLADSLELTLIPHDVPDASVRGDGLLGWAAAGRMVDPRVGVRRQSEVYRPRRSSAAG